MPIHDVELLAERRKLLIEKSIKGLPFKEKKENTKGMKSSSVIKIGEDGVEIKNKRVGRPTLLPEKDTNEMRDSVRTFLDSNKDKLQELFDELREKSPNQALTFYKDLLEFVVPRLQRTENKLDHTPPITVNFQTFNSQTLIQAKANPQQLKQYGNDIDD